MGRAGRPDLLRSSADDPGGRHAGRWTQARADHDRRKGDEGRPRLQLRGLRSCRPRRCRVCTFDHAPGANRNHEGKRAQPPDAGRASAVPHREPTSRSPPCSHIAGPWHAADTSCRSDSPRRRRVLHSSVARAPNYRSPSRADSPAAPTKQSTARPCRPIDCPFRAKQ